MKATISREVKRAKKRCKFADHDWTFDTIRDPLDGRRKLTGRIVNVYGDLHKLEHCTKCGLATLTMIED